MPINASIGESKTSDSELSGRVVPEIHQDNPKWHTSEKTGRFDCQTEAYTVFAQITGSTKPFCKMLVYALHPSRIREYQWIVRSQYNRKNSLKTRNRPILN
ncbi:MAG: hypothetical protein IPH35_06220 [Rhodoferax sp.]|nr:hypothetical protein [Rhodoferax sp.]